MTLDERTQAGQLLKEFAEIAAPWLGLPFVLTTEKNGEDTAEFGMPECYGFTNVAVGHLFDLDAPDHCNDQPRFLVYVLDALEAKGYDVGLKSVAWYNPSEPYECEVTKYDWANDDPRRVIRYGKTRTEAVLAAAVAAKEASSARTQEDK